MYKIGIKRNCELEAPYHLAVENQNDFTHFIHLHRKAILDYRLLYKRGNREIFLYKARWLHPLPFYDTYIVFREYIPSGESYHNIYLNVRSGLVHYLKASVVRNEKTCSMTGEYVFSLPSFWRFCPKLFLWVFKRRMRAIMEEDNDWFRGRMAVGTAFESHSCAPTVPENYDLFEDLFKKGILPPADIYFSDRVYTAFDNKTSEKEQHLR